MSRTQLFVELVDRWFDVDRNLMNMWLLSPLKYKLQNSRNCDLSTKDQQTGINCPAAVCIKTRTWSIKLLVSSIDPLRIGRCLSKFKMYSRVFQNCNNCRFLGKLENWSYLQIDSRSGLVFQQLTEYNSRPEPLTTSIAKNIILEA